MAFDIVPLTFELIPRIVQEDGGPLWQKDEAYWQRCLLAQEQGRRFVFVARSEMGDVAGYCHFNRYSDYPRFINAGVPEIADLCVAKPYRRKGVAAALIAFIEQFAMQEGHKVIGIGVGLYSEYGAAQTLYMHLGYVPDGEGALYHNQPVTKDMDVRCDDHLVLRLTKKLLNGSEE